MSAEQAWEDFKKVYFQGAEDLADGFAEDNPLANSAHYEIYLNDVSMQDALGNLFASHLDGIRKVNQSAKSRQIRCPILIRWSATYPDRDHS